MCLEDVQYMEILNKIMLYPDSVCWSGVKKAAARGCLYRSVHLQYSMIAGFLFALINFAPFSAYGEYRQLDAHEHGVAHLNAVLDGEELVIELVSPAANIVGFEHAPATGQDQEAMQKARTMLMDGGALFRFPAGGAECVLGHVSVDTDLELHAGEENEAGPGHDHGSGEHDSVADDHDHDAHGDFRAEYRFYVGRPAALTYLEVRLMQLFPAVERVKVQLATRSTQTAVELTPALFRVEL
jgi:hypothetical protein